MVVVAMVYMLTDGVCMLTADSGGVCGDER